MPYELSSSSLTDRFNAILFSESNSRFICEVAPEHVAPFESTLSEVPFAPIGEVTATDRVEILSADRAVINLDLATLKEAWQKPLRW